MLRESTYLSVDAIKWIKASITYLLSCIRGYLHNEIISLWWPWNLFRKRCGGLLDWSSLAKTPRRESLDRLNILYMSINKLGSSSNIINLIKNQFKDFCWLKYKFNCTLNHYEYYVPRKINNPLWVECSEYSVTFILTQQSLSDDRNCIGVWECEDGCFNRVTKTKCIGLTRRLWGVHPGVVDSSVKGTGVDVERSLSSVRGGRRRRVYRHRIDPRPSLRAPVNIAPDTTSPNSEFLNDYLLFELVLKRYVRRK